MPIVGYADDINIMGRFMKNVEKIHREFEENTKTIRLKLTLRKHKLWFRQAQISVANRQK